MQFCDIILNVAAQLAEMVAMNSVEALNKERVENFLVSSR